MRKIILSIFSLIACHVSAQISWVQKADFHEPRTEAFAFSIGNYGYIGSGYNGSDVSDMYQWDQSANTWTVKASIPIARSKSVWFSINSIGYVVSGANSSGTVYNDCYEYSPTSNSWTAKTSIPGARQGACGFVIGNYAYVGTGQVTASTYLNNFYKFDPTANTWTAIAPFPGIARCAAFAFSANGKGYVGCGFSSPDGSTIIFHKDFYEYNPVTNTWSQKADFGGGKRCWPVGLTVNNIGYAGTGYDSTYIGVKDIWSYNPNTNNWQLMSNFNRLGRFAAISFTIGNKGYIGTGYQETGAAGLYQDLWEFSDPTSVSEIHATDVISTIFNDHLSIVNFQKMGNIKNICLMDISGKLIKQWKYVSGTTYNVSDIATGMYFIQLETSNGVRTGKVMKN